MNAMKCEILPRHILLSFCIFLMTLSVQAQLYHQSTKSISPSGNIHELAASDAERRLYVYSEDKVQAVDLGSGQVILKTNVAGVTSFITVPQFKFGYCALPAQDKIGMFDLRTLRLRSKPKAGKMPALVIYNPANAMLYAFNTGDNSMSYYEADDGDLMGTVPLPGKPSAAVADDKAAVLYCAFWDKNSVGVVNVKSRKVTAEWPIAPGEKPAQLCLDGQKHLFVLCQNQLLVLDTTTGGLLTSTNVYEGVHIACDSTTGVLCIADNTENVVFAKMGPSGKLVTEQTGKTFHGGKKIAIDPTTHNIYVSVNPVTTTSTQAPGPKKNEENKARLVVFEPEKLSKK